jgi:ABC-type antimicrobial peptide transport system permease subunit
MRSVVRSLDPDLPLYHIRPLREEVDESVAADRTMAILCGTFGVLAVVLTAIGIYGVIAWTVTRRTNEIAVRMALGADPSGILKLVLREVLLLATVGISVGTGLALAASRLVEAKLFGVAARDPGMLAAAIAISGIMALLAATVPAVRALRIDPGRALRFE